MTYFAALKLISLTTCLKVRLNPDHVVRLNVIISQTVTGRVTDSVWRDVQKPNRSLVWKYI